jgi:hypothetical protein
VKLREVAIVELQKRIAEGEGRLKQQQALYEAVRADRNLYSKSLIESQDEIAEMKRKFKIMGHQIEQLKEEISAKDLALVKEHFDHMKVRVDRGLTRGRVWCAGHGLVFVGTELGHFIMPPSATLWIGSVTRGTGINPKYSPCSPMTDMHDSLFIAAAVSLLGLTHLWALDASRV